MPAKASEKTGEIGLGKRGEAVIAATIFAFSFALRFLCIIQLRADPLHEHARYSMPNWGTYDAYYYHAFATAISQGKLQLETAFSLGPL